MAKEKIPWSVVAAKDGNFKVDFPTRDNYLTVLECFEFGGSTKNASPSGIYLTIKLEDTGTSKAAGFAQVLTAFNQNDFALRRDIIYKANDKQNMCIEGHDWSVYSFFAYGYFEPLNP